MGAVSFTLLSMDSSNHSYPVAIEGATVFEVLAPAPVLQIIPSVGPVMGGTRITLSGWNLMDDRVIACIFGRQVVPARHLANDAPTCTTSVFVDVGNTTVAVQTERRGVIPQMSGFLVTAASQIRIYPSLGPLQGGNLVTLVGQSFDQARDVVCFFENYSSSAYFMSSSQLSCQAAPQQAGTVQVQVTLLDDTGRDLTDGSPINYTYTPAPLLLYLEPSVGPSAGGFEVRVVSLDSMWNYSAACLFGNVSASISAKEDGVYRTCTAPTMAPQKLSVWLYWPSVGMLSNGLEFVPRQMSRVLSVHPTVLRTLGGTVMTVFLNTDDPPAAPQCIFGYTNITALWYRASKWQAAKLVCVAPAHAAGAVMLELTADGFALDNGRIPLLYRELIAILELRPSRGATAGGNTVMLRVHPPAAYTPVLCSFGSGSEAKLVQATQISSGSMMCTAPPTSQPGAVSLTLIGHGINISAEAVRYMYDSAPSVFALQPNFGIPGVHSVVTVIGEHFVESETLACRFGAVKAVARWINSGRIACLVPLEWIDTSVVEVSINGVDFTWDGVVLSARDPLTISSFWPGIVVAGSRHIITIYGGPFEHETDHLCVFGREPPVPAHVINAQQLECASLAFSAGNISVAVAVDGVSIEASPHLLQVVPSWQVISTFPAFALVNDSRPVTLFGHGFIGMTCLRCRFEGGHLTHVSEATVRQSNEVLCEYPVLPAPMLRMLVLTCDEVSLSDPVPFEYRHLEPFQVESISPTTSDHSVATLITVRGAGFLRESQFSCVFGQEAVRAEWSSSKQLLCELGSGRAGAITVEVRSEFWYSRQLMLVLRVQSPVVSSVSPRRGTGGILITLQGSHFVEGMKIKIGSEEAEIQSLTANKVTVLVPIRDASNRWIQKAAISTGVAEHSVTATIFAYEYEVAGLIKTIEPTCGPRTGATLVRVQFLEPIREGAMCFFGGVAVHAHHEAMNEISCTTPGGNVGPVQLRINHLASTSSHYASEFIYMELASLDSLSPSMGPVQGNSVVTIVGQDLQSTTPSKCFFGKEGVMATTVSSSALLCRSPPMLGFDLVTVSVALNGIDSSVQTRVFTYFAPVRLLSLKPAVVSSGMLALIEISGESFFEHVRYECILGTSSVGLAEWRSSSSVACSSPALSPGNFTLEVSIGDVRASLNALVFEAMGPLVVSSIEPSRAHAAGGTVIRVSYAGLRVTESAYCMFGNAISKATVEDGSHLSCTAPQAEPGVVSFLVINGEQKSTGSLAFEFFDGHPVLIALRPSTAADTGGQLVTVVGVDLPAEPSTCVFGQIHAHSSFVSSSELACRAPGHHAGTVLFHVMNSEGHTWNSGLSFKFQTAPSIHSIHPSQVSVSAIGGTILTIHGDFVSSTGLLYCRFGNILVSTCIKAVRQRATCTLPALYPARMSLAVSNDDKVYSATFAMLEILRNSEIIELKPSSGSVRGGAVISVIGAHFPANENVDMYCLWGNSEFSSTTKAVIRSATLVMCTSPSWTRGGTVGLRLHFTLEQQGGEDSTSLLFQYVGEAVVSAVSPSEGSLQGGTLIRVVGSGFMSKSERCSLGGVGAETAWQSSTLLHCITPAAKAVGTVAVEVGFNEFEVYSSKSSFAYQPALQLLSVKPTAVSDSDGDGIIITLSGRFFERGGQVYCKFGSDKYVDATVITKDTALCSAPRLVAGNTTVSIGSVGSGLVAGRVLQIKASMKVDYITPTLAPATGDALVSLTGYGFMNFNALKCLFDRVEMPATVSSDSRVICRSPVLMGAKSRVEITSASGSTAQNSGIYLHVNTMTAVFALSPSVGPAAGGFEVTMKGNDFSRAELSCCFGGVIAPARVQNDSMASCVAPATLAVGVAHVPFSHARSGRCMADELIFVYMPVPHLHSIEPSASIFQINDLQAPASVERVVWLTGHDFVKGYLTARFDKSERDCHVVDGQTAKCHVPSNLAAGKYSVSVSNDRNHYSRQNSHNFEILMNPSVSHVIPRALVAAPGGSALLTISGFNFDHALMLKCEFNQLQTSSDVLSPTTMVCRIPSIEQLKTTALSDTVEVAILSFSGNITIWTAAMPIHPTPHVHRISPTVGPLDGGGLVTVYGINFIANSTLCRVAGNFVTAALVLSSSEMSCVLPAASSVGPVSIEAVEGHASLGPPAVSYLYAHSPVVHRVWPDSASLLGKSWVSIYGDNMWNSSSLQVIFGREQAEAVSWVSPRLIQALTPMSLFLGNVTLTVSTTHELISKGISFEFVAETVPVFFPSHGPVAGGTLITVHGRVPARVIACRVGATIVKAGSGSQAPWAGQRTCQIPTVWRGRPQNVGVSILFSDGREIRTGSNYTFDDDIVIRAVLPSAGSMTGGKTEVTILGSGFQNVPELTCLIGNEQAKGVFESSSRLACTWSPTSPGRVAVEVSNNGLDFTSAGTFFTVLKSITVNAIDPAVITVPAHDAQMLTIYGSGFQSVQSYICHIGGTASNATWMGSSELQCPVDSLKPGNFSVFIIAVGSETSQHGPTLQVISSVSITEMIPSVGPVHGGTRLTFTGGPFKTSDVSCGFENLTVSAKVVSSSAVTCLTPAHMQADVKVHLMHGRVSLHRSHLDFRFVHATWPFVTSLWPGQGPVAGGTSVTMRGHNLLLVSECVFGDASVSAKSFTDDESDVVICSTPSGTRAGAKSSVFLLGINTGYLFAYYQDPIALSLKPQYGSLAGDGAISITVIGSGFMPDKQLGCRIGGIAVHAHFVDHERVACHAQERQEGHSGRLYSTLGGLPVEISMNLVDFVLASSEFIHTVPAKILSVSPSLGPSSGYIPLTVVGSGFAGVAALGSSTRVQFGIGEVEAVVVTSTLITCIVPPTEINGAHAVQIRVIDQNSFPPTDSGIAFHFYSRLQISRIEPSRGLSPDRATVTVFGQGWGAHSSLTCKFGSVEGASIILSSTSLLCSSSAMSPGSYALEVSKNASDYSKSGHLVHFEPEPVITSVTPSSIPVGHDRTVAIRGINIRQSATFVCRFGLVDATEVLWISEDQVSCMAQLNNPGNLSVAVSNDGVVFSTPFMILVTPVIPLESLHPSRALAIGGTLVTVRFGRQIAVHSAIQCRFSHAMSPVIFASSSSVQCLSPALSVSSVSVDLVTASGMAVSSALSFVAFKQPVITEVLPSIVSTSGGCLVSVRGHDFLPGALMFAFGDQLVQATFLSNILLLTASPLQKPGVWPVTVSNNNGIDFSQPGPVLIHFSPTPVVLKIEPSSGNLGSVGAVTVIGIHFQESSLAGCKFGALRNTPAHRLSSSHMVCNAPAGLNGNVSIQVTNNGIEFSEPFVSFIGQRAAEKAGSVPRFSFYVLDADGDGQITKAEYGQGFDMIDQNKDSFITELEFNPVFSEPFRLFDKDGDGNISRSEWDSGFAVFDIDGTGKIPNSAFSILSGSGFVFEMLDTDGEGQISQKEYNLGFDILDKDHDGFITSRNFGIAAKLYFDLLDKDGDSKLSSEKYNAGFVVMDVDRDGLIDKTEFNMFVEGKVIPSISRLVPTVGETTGSAIVTVFGRNFPVQAAVRCVFGKEMSHGIVASETEARCTTPSTLQAGEVKLALDFQGQVSTREDIVFEFMLPVKIVSFHPRSAPVTGGSLITLHGEGFGAGEPVCQFGGGKRHAALPGPSSSVLICQAPPGKEGNVTVGVYMASGHGARSQALFTYFGAPLVLSVKPSTSQMIDGTRVTVYGRNFVPFSSCMIEGSESQAFFLSTERLVCVLPKLETPGQTTLIVKIGVDKEGPGYLYSKSLALAFFDGDVVSLVPSWGPVMGGSRVTISGPWADLHPHLSVSFDGKKVQHTSVDGVSLEFTTRLVKESGSATINIVDENSGESVGVQHFVYFNEVQLHSVTPSSVYASGGSSIDVVGSGFQQGLPYGIQFGGGNLPVVAVVSSTMLTCALSPKLMQSRTSLQLVLDDYTFASGLVYQHAHVIEILSVYPTLAANGAAASPVHVIGVGFPKGGRCRFENEHISSAIWVSSSSLSCALPSMSSGATTLQIVSAGFNVNSDVEDQSVASNVVGIQIHEPVKLSAAIPYQGYFGHEMLVHVTGAHFKPTNGLLCMFGKNYRSPARFVSSTAIQCHSPRELPTGSNALSISLNGLDFSDDELKVEIFDTSPIRAIYPVSVALGVPTEITIHGANFVDVPWSCQYGGGLSSHAFRVAADQMRCDMPQTSEGNYSLSLTPGGSVFFDTNVHIQVVAESAFTSIHPCAGPSAGGVAVTVTGRDFEPEAATGWICSFGEDMAPLKLVSSSSIVCVTPVQVAGASSLQIVAHDAHAVSRRFTYLFLEPVRILRVSPSLSSSAGGGAVQVILDKTLEPKVPLWCLFGKGIAVRATQLSDSKPSRQCVVPAHAVGAASLALTFGEHGPMASTNVPFQFAEPATVSILKPSTGLQGKSSLVQVVGSNFLNLPHCVVSLGIQNLVQGGFLSPWSPAVLQSLTPSCCMSL
jgi:Ca2+-binding EF-hand superfamily protein